MARALPIPPSGFDDLSAEEKVDYVQSLWDRIVEDPERVPVPEWHRQVIAERLAAHSADPESARPWDEVREEIAANLKDHRSRQE
jgi:putative addiction module component (TIGR02574 family)